MVGLISNTSLYSLIFVPDLLFFISKLNLDIYVLKLSKVDKYLRAETAEEFLFKKDKCGNEVVNFPTVSYSILILQGN